MNKKACKLLSLSLMFVIGLMFISGCSSVNDMSTGNEYVVENNGNEYYLNAGIIVNLGKDGDINAVGCEETESNNNYEYVDNIKPVSLSGSYYSNQSVYVNNTIYDLESNTLYKYSFTDDKCKLKKDELVINTDVFGDKYSIESLTDLKTDGEYLYFITKPRKEYFNSTSKNNLFKIGKMSLDGKNIELYDDIVASSYTINDGWIYYFDNGYSASVDSYSFDCSKSGLYKMKTDGTEKVMIFDDFEQEKDDYKLLYSYGLEDMKVCGDYMYFTNYDNGQGNICRIKKDGSNFETISKNSAYCFTFDIHNNKLYYVGRSDSVGVTPRKCYEVSLDSLAETELFEINFNEPRIYYYKNYLYLNYLGCTHDEGGSTKLGERYDTVNKKAESIFESYNKKEIKDGRCTSIKYEGPYLEWKSE